MKRLTAPLAVLLMVALFAVAIVGPQMVVTGPFVGLPLDAGVQEAEAQAGLGTQTAPVTNPILGEQATLKGVLLQNAAVATGNGNNFDVSRSTTFAFQVTGTFTGTVTPEASLDGGTTFVALGCAPLNSTTNATTMTAAGIWRCNVTGMPMARVRVSAWSSGSITVIGYASSLPYSLGSTMAP